MPIVVDASALALAVLDNTSRGTSLRERLRGEECHAPHLIDADVGNVLRRSALRGLVTADEGETLLAIAPLLIDHRYEMDGGLAQAAWKLRDNLRFYDALYAALAAAMSVPLLTADGRLAAAPRLPCRVETV